MLKQNKGKAIVSSVVILLPMAAGLLLWNRLPEAMATHWGADGVADGFSGRGFAVFGLPLILLAVHWLCLWITQKTLGEQNQPEKALHMAFWIIPFLSLLAGAVVYSAAFGQSFSMRMLPLPLLGLMFLYIGNYLPKCRRNRTLGIKIKWALSNDENWNATHRFGGKVWVVCGLVMILTAFLPEKLMIGVMAAVLLAAVVLPVLYSALYYKKQVQAGTAPEKADYPMKKRDKVVGAVSGAATVLILAFVTVICFTGNINVHFTDKVFTVEASYYSDLTVAYDTVDQIEYRTDCELGSRRFGFGSPRLSMGTFRNEEFGDYTRYTYTRCDACVVLTSGDRVLVLSGEDAAATEAIYQTLCERIK